MQDEKYTVFVIMNTRFFFYLDRLILLVYLIGVEKRAFARLKEGEMIYEKGYICFSCGNDAVSELQRLRNSR